MIYNGKKIENRNNAKQLTYSVELKTNQINAFIVLIGLEIPKKERKY